MQNEFVLTFSLRTIEINLQVSTEDVMRTGPGITGWSRSYDSCCSAARASSTSWAECTTDYAIAYNAKNFDTVVEITRSLVYARMPTHSDGAAAAVDSVDGNGVGESDGVCAGARDDVNDASGDTEADMALPTVTDAKAAFYLARCMEEGVGCDGDAAVAERLYREAVPLLTPLAVAGDPIAQFALGECYYNGNGVEEDDTVGKMWYKSAALAGHDEAMWAATAFGLL